MPGRSQLSGRPCEIALGFDTGCCRQLICFSDADCDDGERCDPRRGLCLPENACDPTGQTSCPEDQLCVVQEGVATCISEVPSAASCAVAAGSRLIDDGSGAAHPATIVHGATLKLDAVARDAAGALSPHATFAWSGAGVAADGLLTGACEGAVVCEVTVTATTGDASCDGIVAVYPLPAPGSARVVVLDAHSGAPLAGVPVAADLGTGLVDDVTDALGTAAFDGWAGEVLSVSAFPVTHEWHTVLDAPQDVVLFTRENPDPSRVAGLKGQLDFTAASSVGDVKLALAGVSVATGLEGIDVDAWLGDAAFYTMEIEGVTDPGGQPVMFPSGFVFELGTSPIKGDYVALGAAGPRLGWAMGGRLRLSEIGPLVSTWTADPALPFGLFLRGVLPRFGRFDHALVSNLDPLALTTRPADAGDGSAPPYAAWDLPEHTLAPNTLLSRSAYYAMPPLPCTPGGGTAPACVVPAGAPAGASPYARGVVMLVASLVPGAGLVPLGLASAVDDDDPDDGDDFDGLLSYSPDDPFAPQGAGARVDFAPPHDGLEGFALVTVALALDVDRVASGAPRQTTHALTHVTRSYAAADNTLPAGEFVAAQGGTFSASAGTFALGAVGSADFYRVVLDNDARAAWSVWFSDPGAAIDVNAYAPAGVTPATRASSAAVWAFVLGAGYGASAGAPEPASYVELFAFDGADIDNLMLYASGWSAEPCRAATTAGGTETTAHCDDADAPPVP